MKVGDELQLKISKAESASRFEKNSPPEVLRVIEGANHGYSCSRNNARGEVDGYVAWQLYVATWVS